MKRSVLLSTLMLALALSAYAQGLGHDDGSYSKYNKLLDRYDIYDDYGRLQGYYKHNDLLDRWEYHRQ